jgi:hypothetical protein
MAGWTALACCYEEREQLQQLQQLKSFYDTEDDNSNSNSNSNQQLGEEEGGGAPKKKRTTALQLSKLFPTLFTPRAYLPGTKGNTRVQAKPVFAYDPYYLVRI